MRQSKYPRDIAARVLSQVLNDRKPLPEVLAEVLDTLPVETRGWLQEICSGTLRWKGVLDQVIDSIAIKKKPSGWLRRTLLIACYQLIAQDRTNPISVVTETVDEIKKLEGEFPAKFANALLRKVSEHSKEWRKLDTIQALRPSLPGWLWKRLVTAHGQEWTMNFARVSLDRPKLWLHARNSDGVKGIPGQSGLTPGSWEAGEAASVQEILGGSGFESGQVIVQDISNQILIHGIIDEVRRTLGQGKIHALDLCAAPGGKTVPMSWAGFQVSATDIQVDRIRMLEETIKRAAPDAQVLERAQVKDLPAQELVWVDAPCTGTGILRRHPEIRWLRAEKDLPGLLSIQAELIREAWTRVKPGGFLAYSVCSVLKEEGPDQIRAAKLSGEVRKEWFLCPQDPPHGDGFWATLIQKA